MVDSNGQTIITVAPTGAYLQKDTPYVPITPEEIAKKHIGLGKLEHLLFIFMSGMTMVYHVEL